MNKYKKLLDDNYQKKFFSHLPIDIFKSTMDIIITIYHIF